MNGTHELHKAEIVREYGPFSGADSVHGVTYDGEHVWFASGDKLNAFHPTSGKRLRSIDVAAHAGTAFDGQHLFQLAEDRIQKIDPKTGRVLATIPAPGGGADSGLAWAEGTLWVGQYRDKKIHQVDPNTGAILRTIDSNRFVTGVTWVDGELWHATLQGDESDLRRVDPKTGEVLESIEMPPAWAYRGLNPMAAISFSAGRKEWEGEERSPARQEGMRGDRLTIESGLVRRLVNEQFPQWAELPIERVPMDGWDNTTFRLGGDLKVRLPTAARYVAQVEKEYRWLPYLAAFLPLAVPTPVAVGAATAGYPFPWSVYQWLSGERASTKNIADLDRFALDLTQFIIALQKIPVDGGPLAGPHSFFRGGPLSIYDSETRRCLGKLGNEIDTIAASAVWEAALASQWNGPDVWVHGDIAAGNLLVADGKLSAVIDFGSCAVGDPACDLVIAWTFFVNESRMIFCSAMAADEPIWMRARGWALWKALLTLSGEIDHGYGDSLVAEEARRIIDDVVADSLGGG